MKAEFDNAISQNLVQHVGSHRRNFYNVREIIQEGNAALIKTNNGDQHFLNFENVNMIFSSPIMLTAIFHKYECQTSCIHHITMRLSILF